MQITVEITEDFAALAATLGLTPKEYAQELLSKEQSFEPAWEAEALRRASEIDAGKATMVPWEQIEARLRSRSAG